MTRTAEEVAGEFINAALMDEDGSFLVTKERRQALKQVLISILRSDRAEIMRECADVAAKFHTKECSLAIAAAIERLGG